VSGTTVDVIRIATAEIGTRETGTNNVKYNHWLGYIPGYPHSGYGYPWCASFASWVYSHAGLTSGSYPRTASCEAGVAWYKRKGRWAGRIPHVGDQVFYGPGGGTHTEIVIAVGSKSITTIGGNTSGSLSGQFHNGNGVYKKSVARSSSRIYGYGRPVYQAGATPSPAPKPAPRPSSNWTENLVKQLPTLKPGSSGEHVQSLQGLLCARSHSLKLDGDFGPKTEAAVKAVQRWGGVAADGEVGPKTWPVLLRVH
jgi:hypothetical protein